MAFLNKKSALLMLLAILGLGVLIGHHTLPPMDRDESRFAQASKQMVTSGDYVTVRFQQDLRAKKPAGIYWLQSASAALFGVDDIASYRLPSLIAVLLTVFGTYRLASYIYKPPRALLAAATLGASVLVVAEAHLAKTDSVLMLCCFIQQFALMLIYRSWQQDRPENRQHYLVFWLALGVGIMIKGPIAPMLAITTLVALCLWHRSVTWLRRLHIARGLLIVALVTLPWAILVSLATDGAFLQIAFNADFMAKVKTVQESHGAPIGTYFVLAAVLLWPGMLLLPRTLAQMPTLLAHIETRFLLAWIVPFWVVIEFIPTKLPHYPLPVFPALAVVLVCAVNSPIAGKVAGNLREKVQYFATIITEYALLAIGVLLAGMLVWGAVQLGGNTGGRAFAFAVIGGLVAGVAIWQGILWHQRGGVVLFGGMLLAGLAFHFILLGGLTPSLSRIHLSTAITEIMEESKITAPVIAAAGYHEPSLVFLTKGDVLLLDGREAALFLAEAPGSLAIVEQRQQSLFLETAKGINLTLKPPQQVIGVNISKGQDVLIWLYQAETFDGASPSG